jgi:membrane-associated phospholipid phosphatase
MRSQSRALDARLLVGVDLIVASAFAFVVILLALFSPRSVSFWHASVMLPLVILAVLLVVAVGRTLGSAEPSLRALGRSAVLLLGDWLPLVVAVLAYENIHDLTYLIRPSTVDGALRTLDERLFGVTPALAMDAITRPWLTELMSAAYSLYFVYPAALLVLLYRKGDLQRFREVGLGLGLCLYAGLIGYVLVPAVGPRYVMSAEFTQPLVGPWLTGTAARAWNLIEMIDRDCFPSLHTALTLLSLIYFVRLRRVLPHGRRIVAVITPAIVLLWVSTMYLRYHYGVDVLAGAALAIAVQWAAPRLLEVYRGALLKRLARPARSPASVPALRRLRRAVRSSSVAGRRVAAARRSAASCDS